MSPPRSGVDGSQRQSHPEGELVQLAEQLGLHRLAVEDVVQARQRSKRERFGDVLAVALKTLG
ncbi:hypothetical protein [Streptomyces sp. NBC_01367]|uniref:hypothetical protein n=1 Tax=Streptomyces sp. NBC_01367 TaxID=2903841 RepID=UPI00324D2102